VLWTEIVLIALVAAVVIVALVWLAAGRIDRLHRRVDRAWASLHLQLTRRASLALLLAHSHVWEAEPSAAVTAAARAALQAPPGGREHSDLTAALRAAAVPAAAPTGAAPTGGERDALLYDMAAVWYRALVARRFLNDAVSLTRRLRSRRLVRFFHLAGGTPMPATCDIDDAPPPNLTIA
jgi:hypothetical protein